MQLVCLIDWLNLIIREELVWYVTIDLSMVGACFIFPNYAS